MERLSKNHVMREIQEDRETSLRCYAVSYTHLTLPTNSLV